MKKLILSLVTMASLAFAANAVTNMCVKTTDGKIITVDVEKVVEVYYEEASSTADNQGVTVTGRVGDYNYVDLGLPSGTMWATYNVGATKPAEYGDYFAWGETKPKEYYSDSTYKWCKDTGEKDGWGYRIYKYTKYCADSEYGTVDNKTVLEAEDDAATANWGSAWRMPTAEEIDELIDACNWKWMDNYYATGIAGRLGTSVYNGATIFLPAAGYRYTDLYAAGGGDYWSSSLYEYGSYRASHLKFGEYFIDSDDDHRDDGRSVRAVLR
ncbi:MAG: hypothetical protein KBT32_09130 [Bacteroidales bacterium]|nr:hypothetical protein [Candidatus Physcocola equi]